jgi:hypothetical protein
MRKQLFTSCVNLSKEFRIMGKKNNKYQAAIPNVQQREQTTPKAVQDQLARVHESAELPTTIKGVLPMAAEVAGWPGESLDAIKQKLNRLEEALLELAGLQEDRLALNQKLKETDARLAELSDRERHLNERDSAITIHEAEARNGFISQQRIALQSLRDEILRLESERDAVIARTDQDQREARSRIEEAQASFRQERQAELKALDDERRELLDKQRQVEFERQKVEQARLNQQSWEAQTRRTIEDEYRREILELQRQIQQAHTNAGRDAGMIQRQREALNGFEALQRMLERRGFGGPEQLLQRFDELSEENRRLREAQRPTHADDLEAENEELRERCDKYEHTLQDRVQEIGKLHAELATSRASVLEKHLWMQEKRVLEQHKRALDSAVTDLERRLDDLTTRQQGSETFPALAQMDRELIRRAHTEEVPPLHEFANELRHRIATATDIPLYYTEQVIRLFLAGLAMSQLHILQGISGTGKTSLAIAFAKAVGGHCTVVPVQAGWRDRDDLLGHFNAFERRFYERECLQAIYRAGTESFNDRVNVVLLDEMNLSHPEQYFAEFLSALELAPKDRGIVLTETAVANPPQLLRDGRKLPMPDNVWFIGTANQDETTKGFADKTVDRAHLMELPRNEAPFTPVEPPKRLPFSVSSLQKRFDEARQRHEPAVRKALEVIQNEKSGLTRILERDFNLGWGNRLERQALRFVPVVIEASGSIGEAFDHLLATRLFRAGKVTERYDVDLDTLRKLEGELGNVWKQVDSKHDVPIACLDQLEREIQRKERQG